MLTTNSSREIGFTKNIRDQRQNYTRRALERRDNEQNRYIGNMDRQLNETTRNDIDLINRIPSSQIGDDLKDQLKSIIVRIKTQVKDFNVQKKKQYDWSLPTLVKRLRDEDKEETHRR